MSGPPLPRLPDRNPESHKGNFGSAMLIGGTRGMAGAVGLAAVAALRSGAGRVTAMVPQGIQSVVSAFELSIMTEGMADTEQGYFAADATELLLDRSGSMSAAGCGPGLGRAAALTQLVAKLYAELSIPSVFDADALFALSGQSLPTPAAPRILTPHQGEWARLSGKETPTREQAEADVRRWAEQHQAIVALKGHRTFVTDGTRCFHNDTGNPGMATAGSGDVLTGIVTGLLAQGLSAWDAARLGVHLHGSAGDITCKAIGTVGMIASDLLESVPIAIDKHCTDH